MLTFAITLQLAHLLYHQVTTLVDFFPFNGARFASRGEKFGEAAFNFVLMGLPPVGFILRIPALMELGAVYYGVLLGAECATWWLPYFFGPSQKWRETYAKIQARTITIIPRRGTNPAPNLEHLILMVLTLATASATLAAYRALPGAAFRHPWIGASLAVFIVGGAAHQCCFSGRKSPAVTPPSIP